MPSGLNNLALLRHINSYFYQEILPTHALIFQPGFCMKIHIFQNYAFRIRDFGCSTASCAIFLLEHTPDLSKNYGKHVTLMELQKRGPPMVNGSNLRIVAQNVFPRAMMNHVIYRPVAAAPHFVKTQRSRVGKIHVPCPSTDCRHEVDSTPASVLMSSPLFDWFLTLIGYGAWYRLARYNSGHRDKSNASTPLCYLLLPSSMMRLLDATIVIVLNTERARPPLLRFHHNQVSQRSTFNTKFSSGAFFRDLIVFEMLKASKSGEKIDRSTPVVQNGKKKNHPFYIASLFDVFAQLDSEVTGTWGFRNSHMTIVTRDPDSEDNMEWVIQGCAYGGLEIVLDLDGVYFLKGRLIALNQPGEQKFFYEPKNQILATSSKDLKGDLANSVGVWGLGIIISREVVPVSPGRENVIVVVRHTDYNPDIRGLSSFDVEYRCPWSPLMEKLQPLLITNREVLLVGHIVGKDTVKHMWIVEMTGVSVTSGPALKNSAPAQTAGGTIVTPGGRSRGKMIFDDSAIAVSNSKNNDDVAETKPNQETSTKKRAPAGTGRGQKRVPAKKAKSGSEVDIGQEEGSADLTIPAPVNNSRRSAKGKEKVADIVEQEEMQVEAD
ncbi:hypothetical protein DFH28DRAFT_1122821 [Melampsora americana]|nr:hypothetical protein DFH28DRAFT_1122821 [Melampsora americana]